VVLGAERPQLAGHQLEIEAREIDEIPDGEREELALIYEAKGLEPAQARELAARADRRPLDRAHHLPVRDLERLDVASNQFACRIAAVSRADASACWISSRKAGANSHAGRASDRPCVPRR
jgi:hypothetical protein